MQNELDYAWFWLLANSGEVRDLLIAAAAAGVVPFLGYRAWVARKLVAAEQRTAEATELGKSAEVMAAAFAGLGGAQIQIRVGAIYTLERHARERPRDQGPIVQTLAAFVRDRCPAPVPFLVDGAYRAPTPEAVYRPPATDIQAAVSVLGRRQRANDPPNARLSLAGTPVRASRAPISAEQTSPAPSFCARISSLPFLRMQTSTVPRLPKPPSRRPIAVAHVSRTRTSTMPPSSTATCAPPTSRVRAWNVRTCAARQSTGPLSTASACRPARQAPDASPRLATSFQSSPCLPSGCMPT
jgi:hypothetical protein